MGISVEMFCKTYKANLKAKDKTFEDFIKKHITTDYINFNMKDAICTNIIKTSCYEKSGDREIIKINSLARYMLFIMNLIKEYTDIEIEFKDGKAVEQYDELNKIGAISTLISAIPESEYAEFNTILNMKLDDLRDNEYSVIAFLYNFKESLSISEDVINSAIEMIVKQDEDKNE